jgi:hypothetical protein
MHRIRQRITKRKNVSESNTISMSVCHGLPLNPANPHRHCIDTYEPPWIGRGSNEGGGVLDKRLTVLRFSVALLSSEGSFSAAAWMRDQWFIVG